MVEWSRACGGAPIYIPLADREWVQRDDPAIVTWRGTRELAPGVTLVQCGGQDRKSTRLNSSHSQISYAVFCLKKKQFSPSSHFFTTNPRTTPPPAL